MQLSLDLRKTAKQRFLEKLVFNPFTGCVLWAGGTSAGGGRSIFYPTFWDGEKMVRGHIWAAEHLHGLKRLPGYHVDHQCRVSLCVFHLRILPGEVNRSLASLKRQKMFEDTFNDIPYYRPPDWCPPNIPYVTNPKEFYAEKMRIKEWTRRENRCTVSTAFATRGTGASSAGRTIRKNARRRDTRKKSANKR